jgi:hypothetical protein
MNFAKWILKRMHRKMFGGEWGWLYKYREFIQEEMPLSILLTVLIGALWTLVLGIAFANFIDDRNTLLIVMKCVISCPPLFFIYNWLAALYEIYDAERMATWDRLKEQ